MPDDHIARFHALKDLEAILGLDADLDGHAALAVALAHDDEAAALDSSGPLGKTEAWHVLAAAPGAELFLGLAAEGDSADLVAAARSRQSAVCTTSAPPLSIRPGQSGGVAGHRPANVARSAPTRPVPSSTKHSVLTLNSRSPPSS